MSSIAQAYDQWSASYDSVENKTRDLDQKATSEVLGTFKWSTVLEWGCGTGKNTAWLAQRAAQIVAIDFSEGMLAVARQKFASANIQFQQGDITQPWTFPGSPFDLITCNLMLEHIAQLPPAFTAASKNLKENGYFFVSELHPFKQYTGSKARFTTGAETVVLDCYTHHISDYLSAAKSAGLALLQLREWFDADNPHLPRLLTLLFKKE